MSTSVSTLSIFSFSVQLVVWIIILCSRRHRGVIGCCLRLQIEVGISVSTVQCTIAAVAKRYRTENMRKGITDSAEKNN